VLKIYEGTKTYTVFTHCGTDSSGDSTTHVFLNKWETLDPDQDGDTIGGLGNQALNQVFTAGTQQDEMTPGEHFTLQTRVAVPYAVAEGEVSAGDLQVIVESN
jgi:hypothetical protein